MEYFRTALRNGSLPFGGETLPLRIVANGTIFPYRILVSSASCEIFEPLKDPSVFRAFKLDGTLTWDHGADFAPEFLHELVRRQSVERAEPSAPAT